MTGLLEHDGLLSPCGIKVSVRNLSFHSGDLTLHGKNPLGLMSDRRRTPFTEMGIQDKREPSIRDLSSARTGHGGATYL